MKNLFFLFLFLAFTSCDIDSSNSNASVGFAKKLTEEEVVAKTMNDFVSEEKTQADKDRNIIINYIIDQKLDMQSTPDGIYYQITKEGTGNYPTVKDQIVTHYHGTFLNGKVFDSSIGKDPFSYPLRKMNDGWKKALPLMKAGSKGVFIIPSGLCYGEEGLGKTIPPNSILKFEIELLGIKGE